MLDLLIMTGTSRGIGSYTAKKCEPITKKMIGISSTQSSKWERDINCIAVPYNLTDYEGTYTTLKKTLECAYYCETNEVGIVLCASTLGQNGGILNSDLKEWENAFDCNVLGNLTVVKAALKTFGKEATYRIVFFAGGGAAYGYPDFSGYALSKVATVRAAENLAMELKKSGYKASVIVISPGAVETQMLKRVVECGGEVKTRTDIDEPASFVYRFLSDDFEKIEGLNGRFLHVRDDLETEKLADDNHFKLRRIM